MRSDRSQPLIRHAPTRRSCASTRGPVHRADRARRSGAAESRAARSTAAGSSRSCPRADADRDYARARARRAAARTCCCPGSSMRTRHAAMTLLSRHRRRCAARSAGSRTTSGRARRASSAPDFVYDGTLLAAAEMLRGGITCCNDMYFFPDAAAARVPRDAACARCSGLPVLDFPTPYAADADAYLQRGLAVRDACKHEPRLSFALAPHAPYTVGDATLAKDRHVRAPARPADPDASRRNGATKSAQSRDRYGDDAARAAARARRHGPGFIAIHGVHLDGDDIELLATQAATSCIARRRT